MEFWLAVVIIASLVFTVGGIALVLDHFQRMAKIKADSRTKNDSSVSAAIEAVRREVAELRDTSTRYDMSFDAALQRMEARVGHLENRAAEPMAKAEEPRHDDSLTAKLQ